MHVCSTAIVQCCPACHGCSKCVTLVSQCHLYVSLQAGAHLPATLCHVPSWLIKEKNPSSDQLALLRCGLQDFYKTVVLPKLNPGGIFITQSGPAGILSCTEVFTCINKTLCSVFPKVISFTQHMPVYCDVWGWNLALTDPSQSEALTVDEMDKRLADRVVGPMRFLDGETFKGICQLNKHLRKCLAEEQQVYTSDSARFIHGKGSAASQNGLVKGAETQE